MQDDGDAIRAEILRLEKTRCAALVAGDLATLEALMADDLVHVHGNGHMDDKAAYLHGVATKFRFHRVERGDLNIRIYDNVVVVLGPLSQTISLAGSDAPRDISALTGQTWVLGATGWKQNTCQNQFLPTPAAH